MLMVFACDHEDLDLMAALSRSGLMFKMQGDLGSS